MDIIGRKKYGNKEAGFCVRTDGRSQARVFQSTRKRSANTIGCYSVGRVGDKITREKLPADILHNTTALCLLCSELVPTFPPQKCPPLQKYTPTAAVGRRKKARKWRRCRRRRTSASCAMNAGIWIRSSTSCSTAARRETEPGQESSQCSVLRPDTACEVWKFHFVCYLMLICRVLVTKWQEVFIDTSIKVIKILLKRSFAFKIWGGQVPEHIDLNWQCHIIILDNNCSCSNVYKWAFCCVRQSEIEILSQFWVV